MTPQDIENDFVRGVYSSRDLRLADPRWLVFWPELKEAFGMETGLNLEVSTTYRSSKAQSDLYQLGRTKPGKIVTNCDGYKVLSEHNIYPSRAIDTWVHLAGKNLAVWDIDAFDVLGKLAKKMGLIWGGDFEKLRDRPHVEIPVSLTSAHP